MTTHVLRLHSSCTEASSGTHGLASSQKSSSPSVHDSPHEWSGRPGCVFSSSATRFREG